MIESVDYRAEFNIEDFVDKYVERVNREIDQRALGKVEHRLAEYGYVKVVRCRDCIYYEQDPYPIDPGWPMMCERTGDDMVEPDGFCAWAVKRKDGGE